jgi:peptidoglycan/xylan/chitin deacetylase (PgdA/CDA1 family)
MTLARKASKATLTPLGWPARRRRGDVVVLLYHRVGRGVSEIELAPEVLEHHLQALVATERVLTLDDVLAGAPGGGVVVTFDDGYRDFHGAALPLLAKYRVPATLYLATGLVANGAGTPHPEALTWTQLREAAGTGLVTIGSHTHGHTDLSRATEPEAESEMRRSKGLIEQHLQTSCDHFAYPWAVAGSAADRVARRMFKTAALDAWRTNRVGRIDLHRLGRVPILRSDGQFFFRRKVRGQLDSEAWLYRALGRGPWGRV